MADIGTDKKYRALWGNEPEEPKKPNKKVQEEIATAVRSGTGAAGVRIGSALASSFATKIPVVGQTLGIPIAAAIGGGGEAVAEKLEGRPLNWKRIGVEAGLSAVPFGREASWLRNASKGAALAGVGLAGRKATSEDAEERKTAFRPDKWGAWDAAQMVLGAGMGAAVGPRAKKVAGTFPADNPKGVVLGPTKEDTLEQTFLREGKKTAGARVWTPEKIAEKASELEASGHAEAAQGLRVAALDTKIGNERIYDRVAADASKSTAQTARNLTAQEKFIAKTQQEYARSENAREKFVERLRKASTGAQASKERDTFKAWVQEAKNLDAGAKKAAEQEADVLTQRRMDELVGAGGKKERVARTQIKTTNPKTGETVVVTDTVKKPRGKKGSAPGTSTATSAPAAATSFNAAAYDALKKGGLKDDEIISLAKSPEERAVIENVITAAQKKISRPSTAGAGTPAPITKTKAPSEKAPAVAQTKKTAKARTPKMVETSPLESASPVAREVAEARVEEMAKLRGTPEDMPKGLTPVEQARWLQLEAERQAALDAYKKEQVAAPARASESKTTGATTIPKEGSLIEKLQRAVPQTGPAAASLPKSWEPFAKTAAEENVAEQAAKIPLQFKEPLARFFRNPKEREMAVERGKQVSEQAGPEAATAISNLYAQMEALNRTTRTARTGPGRALGARIQAVRRSFGLAAPKKPAGGAGGVSGARVAPEASQEVSAEPVRSEEAQALMNRIDKFTREQAALAKSGAHPTELQRRAMEAEQEAIQADLQKLNVGESLTPPTVVKPTAQQMQPRLNKTKKAPLGGEAGAISPELAIRLGTTALGAGAGAAYNDEDPLSGAILGGAAGLAGPELIKRLGQNVNRESTRSFARSLPNLYRFGLLSHPVNLPINAIAAPYGSGLIGSTERALAGKLEGNDTDVRAFLGGIRNLANPEHGTRLFRALRDARSAMEGINERGEMLMGEAPTVYDKALAVPSSLMYAGDLATRRALQDAGVSEDIAREITLTANPKTPLGEALANFPKKHPALTFLQPFSRTAANIIESGAERAPGIGVLWNMVRDPAHRQSFERVAVQQGVGTAVYLMARYAGQNIDSGDARTKAILTKLITNMSGQYGAVAAAGLAAGFASQVGKPEVPAAVYTSLNELPLPETRDIYDTVTSLSNLASGQPAHERALHAPEKWLPRTLMPGFLRDDQMEWYRKAFNPQSSEYVFKW